MFPVELRYIWPSELHLMAEFAGLRLRERWGMEARTLPAHRMVHLAGRTGASLSQRPVTPTPPSRSLCTGTVKGIRVAGRSGRSIRVDEKLTERRDEASLNGIR